MSRHRFKLSPKEEQTFRLWKQKHEETCKDTPQHESASLRYTVSFIATAVGMKKIVTCSCGKEEDVTDYDSW